MCGISWVKSTGEPGESRSGDLRQRIKHRKKGRHLHFSSHPGGLVGRDPEGAVVFADWNFSLEGRLEAGSVAPDFYGVE